LTHVTFEITQLPIRQSVYALVQFSSLPILSSKLDVSNRKQAAHRCTLCRWSHTFHRCCSWRQTDSEIVTGSSVYHSTILCNLAMIWYQDVLCTITSKVRGVLTSSPGELHKISRFHTLSSIFVSKRSQPILPWKIQLSLTIDQLKP